MFHGRYRFFTIDIQKAPPFAIPQQPGLARSELAARYETIKMKVQASFLLSFQKKKKEASLMTVVVYILRDNFMNLYRMPFSLLTSLEVVIGKGVTRS